MKQEQNWNLNSVTPDFQIYVMCGIPGCGKSTFIKKHFYGEFPIVSRDEIRLEMLGECDDYFAHEDEVYRCFINSIVGVCGVTGKVVVDATHISKGSRRKLFAALDEHIKGQYETTMVVLDTPLKTCLARNAQRSGRALVPEAAIHSMAAHFCMPQYNEHPSIKEIWKVGSR